MAATARIQHREAGRRSWVSTVHELGDISENGQVPVIQAFVYFEQLGEVWTVAAWSVLRRCSLLFLCVRCISFINKLFYTLLYCQPQRTHGRFRIAIQEG